MLFSKPMPRIDDDPPDGPDFQQNGTTYRNTPSGHIRCAWGEGGQILFLVYMEFPVNQNPKHLSSLPLWSPSSCTGFVKLAFNGDQKALFHFLLGCPASLSTAITQLKRTGRPGRKSQKVLQSVHSSVFLTHNSPRFLEGFWEMSSVGAVVMGTVFSKLKIRIPTR